MTPERISELKRLRAEATLREALLDGKLTMAGNKLKAANDQVERRASSTFAPTPGSARWKSNATWPDGETTSDLHDTEEQARAVCQMLKRDGLGGLQEVYPTKTWVAKDE